jgi:NAD(P)-dependent dehydrogenase (short-subunit alcohol dehydrogenase family)
LTQQLDLNLTGTFLMCQDYLPQVIESGYGRIINMSSARASWTPASGPAPPTRTGPD